MIGFGNPTNPTSTHAIYTQVGMNDSALSVMLWLVIFVFSANEPTNLYWPTSKRPYPGRFFRTSVMNILSLELIRLLCHPRPPGHGAFIVGVKLATVGHGPVVCLLISMI